MDTESCGKDYGEMMQLLMDALQELADALSELATVIIETVMAIANAYSEWIQTELVNWQRTLLGERLQERGVPTRLAVVLARWIPRRWLPYVFEVSGV
jgi:hypothetical protein